MKLKPKAQGVGIHHATKRSGMALLPIFHKPLFGDSVKKCPTCRIIHTDSYGKPVKTVHLYLNDSGDCIVSTGVLEDLKKAGHLTANGALPPTISVVATVDNPPGITLGRDRFEVDQDNSKIHLWKGPVIV